MGAISERFETMPLRLASAKMRQRVNMLIFLGPAVILTVLFFILPVIVDVVISFTDMGRSLRVTEFTFKQYEKVFVGDRPAGVNH